jgi:AAA+ ATPase superfamily predicted ATPase
MAKIFPKKFLPADHFRKDEPFAMVVIGARRSGKSYVIRHIYINYLKTRYDITMVFTTSANKPFYDEFIRSTSTEGTVFVGPPADNFIDVIDEIQGKMVSMGKKKMKYLVIFDDLISNSLKQDESMSEIFTRGRHSGVSMIFASQAVTRLHTTWRGNVDYAVIFNVIRGSEREFIIKEYLFDMEKHDAVALLDSRVKHTAIIKDCTGENDQSYYLFNAGKDMTPTRLAVINANRRKHRKS